MNIVRETRLITSTEEAATILRRGGLVALPTETVYGLGARADDAAAVARIFEAKDRPADNPLIAHVSSRGQVESLVRSTPEWAMGLMEAFWPGPLTLVLPARETVPSILTAGLSTVGVRMPDHAATLAVIESLGVPVAAPSANRSGRPSPTTWEAVRDDLDGRIDAILQADPTSVGLESTVVDCTGEVPVILRPGAITLADLKSVHPGARPRTSDDHAHRSPGLRHRHYRPEAEVRWVGPFGTEASDAPRDLHASIELSGTDPDPIRGSASYIGLHTPPLPSRYTRLEIVPSLEMYARELFRFFRTCESEGIRIIHCERVPAEGLGQALIDRIDRAAGGG